MVFIPGQSMFYMFGGQIPSYLTESSTWAFDPASSSWSHIQTSGQSPRGRADPIMTAVTGTNGAESAFLFGGWYNDSNGNVGRLNDTWLFSPTANRWVRVSTSVAPSPRSDSAVAFDSRSDEVMIYGGYNGSYLSDTWAFHMNNESWSMVSPVPSTGPPPLADARMGFDSADGVLVMFGGNNGMNPSQGFNHYNTTWVFDASTRRWRNMSPSSPPPARDYAFFSYDRTDNLFILFGGYGQGIALSDTWTYSYTDNAWRQLYLGSSPTSRYAGGAAYDDASAAFLIYGGVHGEDYLRDTWLLRFTTPSGPLPDFTPLLALVATLAVVTAIFLWSNRESRLRTAGVQ